MAKKTTIAVRPEIRDAINALCERWNVSANEVIARLLQIYEAYTQSDEEARSAVQAFNQTAPATVSSPPLIEPEPAEPTEVEGEIRQVVADMLYLMDAAIEVLFTITTVYPDLRSECGPLLDRLSRRFTEVAQAWGLWREGEGTEEATEEEAEERGEGIREGTS